MIRVLRPGPDELGGGARCAEGEARPRRVTGRTARVRGRRQQVLLLLAALAACGEAASAPDPGAPAWAYAPAPIGWPAPRVADRFGRSDAPTAMVSLGLTGAAAEPLRKATPWAVPGDGPARAVLYGFVAGQGQVELVEVDAGRVVWRDPTTCPGPVVGVTSDAIVCADSAGVRALGLDGKLRWKQDASFLAMTDERVVVSSGGSHVVVLEAGDGAELTRLTLPAAVAAYEVVAACGDVGRELFAAREDGTLARITDSRSGSAVTWAIAIDQLVEIDACTGETILVVTKSDAGMQSVLAIARATGAVLGQVTDVRGHWKSREGDGLELATLGGIVRVSRDLVTRTVLADAVLGAALAERGPRRLVAAEPGTAVLLDEHGLAGYVAFAWPGAVLGDQSILATRWDGSAAHSVARVAVPPVRRDMRLAAPRAPVIVPVELRDLPAAVDATGSFTGTGGADGVLALAATPELGHIAYAAVTEAPPSDTTTAGVARLDLETKSVAWTRPDGCGPGLPVGLAATARSVACAAQGATSATVRVSTSDGAAAWEWTTDIVDAVQAAGDVILVFAGDHATVLDLDTGTVRGVLVSPDGGPARALAVTTPIATTYVVAAEGNRLVARVPAASMLPLWSLAVDGLVLSLSPLDGAVVVALADGDAFRVDLGMVSAIPLAGIGLAWSTSGELILGTAAGDVIPGDPADAVVTPPPAEPPLPRGRRRRGRRPLPAPPAADRPAIATPHPLPAPLGAAWHLALYHPGGRLRARNEYPLFPPIQPATVRGPGASPIVVLSGAERREVLVIDPATGDPLRRVLLPDDAVPGLVGGGLVKGVPTAYAVAARPLRVFTF